MTNADKFKQIFGSYATELWSKPEKEYLEWLNKKYDSSLSQDELDKCFADIQKAWDVSENNVGNINTSTAESCTSTGSSSENPFNNLDLATEICELKNRIVSSDGQDYVQLYDVLETIKRHKEPCTDAISRQATIDAFHTWFRDGFDEDKWWNSTHVLTVIEGMPSVHQKYKWETCFECPLSHGCPKIKGCTNEQAIEYASEIPNDCPLFAQPEPKTGHWEKTTDGYCYWYKCSCCGTKIPKNEWGSDYFSPYCPECGAKMVEPQERSDKE